MIGERTDVLVSQNWGRIGYNVVRSLGRRGLTVVVGTDKFGGTAPLSKYASARFRHPLPNSETAAFLDSIKTALVQYAPRVYLPLGDDTYVVARHLSQLEDSGVAIPVAPFETIRTLYKKNEAMALATSLGIPTPETIVPTCKEDIIGFCRQYGSPIVLKCLSASASRGVFYFNADQIRQCNGDLPHPKLDFGNFLLQQYVRGVGYGVSLLFNQGQLRAKFTHKRLRERFRAGGMSTLRTGVVNPVLEEYAERLLEAVGFHGVAMVEFKHDDKSGETWLLEVNPRFWGSLSLAIQSGVDFPYLLYRMATDGDISPVTRYETGKVVKWILGDLSRILNWNVGSGRWPGRVNGYDDFYWDEPFLFMRDAGLCLRKQLGTRNWTAEDWDLDIEQL